MNEAQLIAVELLAHIERKQQRSNLVIDFFEFIRQKETRLSYLSWMCRQIIHNPQWDMSKAHRWVGYIQGVLVCRGFSTVDEERRRVRDIRQSALSA